MSLIELRELMTLEKYDEARPSFRKAVIAHKRNRQIAIGPDIILSFEDRTTIQYQIQDLIHQD